MAEVFANSEDADQTPHSAASDLGLHCLPNTLLGVSRLQWVKMLDKVGLHIGRQAAIGFQIGTPSF